MFLKALQFITFFFITFNLHLSAMNFIGDINMLGKNYVGTSFSDGDLSNVTFVGQDLSEVDFRGTNLSGANLIGTKLTNVKMDGRTNFSGTIGWQGNLLIQPHRGREQKPLSLTPLSGQEIKITKEWLINQGVIFEK